MFKKLTRKNLEIFLKKYQTNQRVLDIGSGGSNYQKYFPQRLTVDLDPTRKPEIVADIHNLPFREGEFEVILCTEVLEHVKNPSQAINEIRRVLKKGGLLILTTRFVYPLHDVPNDYWRYTKYGLRELFKDWEILELKAETTNFSTLAVLLQRLAFQTELKLNKLTKLLIFITVAVCDKLNFLIVKEYGDIKKETRESDFMASGYYLAAKK